MGNKKLLRGPYNWKGIVDAGNESKALEETISIYKNCRTNGPTEWQHMFWAFGQARIDHDIAPKGFRRGGDTCDLQDVLTKVQIDYLAKECGITSEYVPVWGK